MSRMEGTPQSDGISAETVDVLRQRHDDSGDRSGRGVPAVGDVCFGR